MNPSPVIENLTSPAILFFLLGVIATLIRSDLNIPTPIARGLSIYLLMAIGLHGGVELARSGITAGITLILAIAVLGSILVPLISYAVLRFKLDPINAAAVAACYGSISAVTFITATSFLDASQIPYGGYMVAAMALMESPAIIVGVLIARLSQNRTNPQPMPWGKLGHEAFLNSAVLILLGSLLIGYVTGDNGYAKIKPFMDEPFYGLLCLFLLDMGLIAAQRLRDLGRFGPFLILFAIAMPAIQAVIGISLSKALGFSDGDTLLMAVLWGSASYIAVPAALRLALPNANASLYLPLSLGITFPFNIAIGIPMYLWIIESF
ncbi:sodium-dependent bicarbonate transport family permease [Mucisphaera sp.]|uniref:sodium-dependent bicarbonate transport family permease n=1 Tax=Mucisphaera sp. TaxID=2913024 RepID=UPI003D12A5C3